MMDEKKLIKDSVNSALIQNCIENYSSIAKLYKGAYDALVQEGFIEVQALQIIMARGWNLN